MNLFRMVARAFLSGQIGSQKADLASKRRKGVKFSSFGYVWATRVKFWKTLSLAVFNLDGSVVDLESKIINISRIIAE